PLHDALPICRAALGRTERLRPEDGRAADGAHHPGAHQAAAGGGAAVRPPGERRPRARVGFARRLAADPAVRAGAAARANGARLTVAAQDLSSDPAVTWRPLSV